MHSSYRLIPKLLAIIGLGHGINVSISCPIFRN